MSINKELLKSFGLGFVDGVLAASPGCLAGITTVAYAEKYNLFGKYSKYLLPFATAAVCFPITYLAKRRVDNLESSETGVEILQDVCRDYQREIKELRGEEDPF